MNEQQHNLQGKPSPSWDEQWLINADPSEELHEARGLVWLLQISISSEFYDCSIPELKHGTYLQFQAVLHRLSRLQEILKVQLHDDGQPVRHLHASN